MYLPEEDNRLIFNLTIKQFSELIKRIVRQEIEIQLKNRGNSTDVNVIQPEICEIEIACEITHLSKATIYSKVSLGHIPYISRKKPLLFSKEHLRKWLEADRPKTNSINEVDRILAEKNKEIK